MLTNDIQSHSIWKLEYINLLFLSYNSNINEIYIPSHMFSDDWLMLTRRKYLLIDELNIPSYQLLRAIAFGFYCRSCLFQHVKPSVDIQWGTSDGLPPPDSPACGFYNELCLPHPKGPYAIYSYGPNCMI